MSSSPKINASLFFSRLARLYSSWKEHRDSFWMDANVIAVFLGREDNEENRPFSQTESLYLYLFGYELVDTLLFFKEESAHIILSQKKADILKSNKLHIKDRNCPVEFILHEMPSDPSTLQEFLKETLFTSDGEEEKLGVLTKEQNYYGGRIVRAWMDTTSDKKTVDISNGIAEVLAVKDAEGIISAKKAAQFSSIIMNRVLIRRIERVIEEGNSITHLKLSDDVGEIMIDTKQMSKIKQFRGMSEEERDGYDSAFPPMILSGGDYSDLSKFSSFTNYNPSKGNIDAQCIVCVVGGKYSSFCATIGRTVLINPTGGQEAKYKMLLKARTAALECMVGGNKLSTVYDTVIGVLKEEGEEESHWLTNFGFAMGIELRESRLVLSDKNENQFIPNTYYNLQVGLQKCKHEITGKEYSLYISDTVLIEEKGESSVLTSCPVEYGEISYALDKDEEEVEEDEKPDTDAHSWRTIDPANIIEEGPRVRQARQVAEADELKEVCQKNAELLDELMEKNLGAKQLDLSEEQQKFTFAKELALGKIVSYRNEKEIPLLRGPQVYEVVVDVSNETVLLPINGRHVPFHVSAIKNITEFAADFFYLRINFSAPGESGCIAAQIIEESAVYVKEVSFRSADVNSLQTVRKQIQDLVKRVKQRETSRNEAAGLVEQGNLLVEKISLPFLDGILMRPKSSKNRAVGRLEAHKNGFQFVSQRDDPVVILYSNVESAFFQPARTESIVILHLHLVNPILVGKKQQQDIQFYTHSVEEIEHLVGRSAKYLSEDQSIEREQRELDQKRRINRDFKRFVEKAEAKFQEAGFSEKKFERPMEKLSFKGSYGSNLVDMYPTKTCLVALSDYPFFVLPFEDIEVVWFERLNQMHVTKNFDLVLIKKDYRKGLARIDSIQRYYAERDPSMGFERLRDRAIDLMQCFNAYRIPFFETTAPLNWNQIIRAIVTQMNSEGNEDDAEGESDVWDPWGENGWRSYLMEDESDEESENEPGEDDYQPESEEVESEGDSDFSADSEDDDFEPEPEEERGEDWDVLERKAQEDDKKREYIFGEAESAEPSRKYRRRH